MKKTLVFGFALAFSITPLSTFAAVNSVNGLTAADQSLVTPGPNGQNTMHMDIVTVGTDTHRFKWDGTPWRVDQGGTGWTNLPAGAFLFGNGTSPIGATYSPSFGFINATTTDATSRFDGNVSVAGNVSLSEVLGLDAQQSTGSFGGLFVEPLLNRMTVYHDFRLPLNWGSILLTDPTGTIDWAIITAADSGEGYIGLWNPRGGTAELNLNELGGETTKILTFPNYSGTFGLLEADQKWTGTNTFSKGTAATTTVNFGEMGDATSHVCFNTKNTDGQDISFYFVGTSMVVENNACQ